MQTETPRGPDDEPLCGWCGGPMRQPGTGRRRVYCRRSCRQRAYEAREAAEMAGEARRRGVSEGYDMGLRRAAWLAHKKRSGQRTSDSSRDET